MICLRRGGRGAARVQLAVGFGGGQALVPEVDGEAGLGAQRVGELLRLAAWGLRSPDMCSGLPTTAWVAACLRSRRARDLSVGAEAPLPASAVEGEERLRGVAQRIGYGDADAPLADIEAGDAADQACWLRVSAGPGSVVSGANSATPSASICRV